MDKNLKIEKKPHAPKKPQKSSGKRNIPLIMMVFVGLLLIIGSILLFPLAFSKSEKEVTIIIPRGATYSNVEDSIRKYYPKAWANRTLHLIKTRHPDFSKRSGLFVLPAGTSPFAAMRKLTSGNQTPVRLTINHFRSIESLSEAIAARLECSNEEFLKAARDSSLLAEFGLTPQQALSLFLEDTYEVYWNTSPRDVIKKIGENYRNLWDKKNRDSAESLGVSPAGIMTIASITDEETNKTDEKGRIGMLYINRLNSGMRLQADPTVRYALGDFDIRRVTLKHLHIESPYNTYRVDGLPPGPIRTTSAQTVNEILNAESSDDLYMCAKEDFSGYHNFASTYEEHVRNSLRYQHELDNRGIK